MVLSLLGKLNEMSDSFKGWLISNNRNPVLWLGLFFGGILVFLWAYNVLHKDK